MASLTQWTWVWANSRRWGRKRKPSVLQSIGWQRVGHNLATEKQQHTIKKKGNILWPFTALENECGVWLVAQSCPTLWDSHGLQPTSLLCPWGFSKREYWSGLPWPLPEYLPNPGIKPRSAFQADSFPTESPSNFKLKTLFKRDLQC